MVIFGEIARRGLADAELALESVGGLLGDVLVEGARGMTRFEDAQDRLVGECSEACGMGEGFVEVLGGEALTQHQDAPSDAPPVTRRSRAEVPEELR